MNTRTLSLLLGLLAAPAYAHHSFAPHFDIDKPVDISGTVTEYEARNPHSYLHVAAVDENGKTQEYVCESHGVTQLTRNGITPAMLARDAQNLLHARGPRFRLDAELIRDNALHIAGLLSLKQGAGRLIRDETDRGVLMLCDPRLTAKAYGRQILKSLPPMKPTRSLAEVAEFLAVRP